MEIELERKEERKKERKKKKMIKIQAGQASTRRLAPRVPRLRGGRDEGKMRGEERRGEEERRERRTASAEAVYS